MNQTPAEKWHWDPNRSYPGGLWKPEGGTISQKPNPGYYFGMNWRFWRFWGKKEFEDAGEKARRIHGQWLTVALSSNRKYPSIPVRPVTEGGFDPLLSRPSGEARAAQWWDAAFQRMDKVESLDDNLPDMPSEDLPPR